LKIVLARVDGRLIHGQVAVAWTRTCGADHIMVVHDETANDEFQRMLLEMATPSGVNLSIYSIKAAAEKINSGGLSGKFLLIFKNAQDVLRLVEEGVPLSSVNVGGLYHEPGKIKIDNALFINEEDKETLKKLNRKGIELIYQVAPMNKKEDLAKKLSL
jgi:mannose/fructose/sorbose-specific phosphotransferase system IIB component